MLINNAVLTGSFIVNGVNYITNTPSTGSNTFVGTQTISGSTLMTGSLGVTGSVSVSGSITATGTLTAQTLVVQTVTSSIVYSSGSNIFGNQLTDVQQMTGSLRVTGSLSLNNTAIPTSASLASTYLPLAGGTLTGALSGTSATFSGNVGLGATSSYAKFNISTGDDNQMAIGTTSVGQTVGIYLADGPTTSSVGYKWEFGKNTSNNFFIYSYGTAANALLINYSTGAATFSSTVKVGGASGGDSLVSTANAGINPAAFSFVNTGGTSYIGAESSGGGSLVTGDTGYDLVVRGPSGITFSANNGASPNMRITSGGAVYINTVSALPGSGTVLHVYSNDACVTFANNSSGQQVLLLWNKATSGNNLFQEFATEADSINGRGSIDFNRAATLVRYNTTSDANLKNIIGDSNLEKSINILNTTKIKEFSWKEDDTNKVQIGVIAQELYETYKGAVSVGSDKELLGTEDYKSWKVDKTAFTFHLIAGWQKHEQMIQEQQATITSLQERLTALENK